MSEKPVNIQINIRRGARTSPQTSRPPERHAGEPSPTGARRESEPILDKKEIQGNILAGFNKDHQAFLFLRIHEEKIELVRDWLRRIEPLVATLEEVISFNRLFKTIRRRRGSVRCIIQSTWLNIGFSFQGLRKLTGEADQFVDEAFRQGLHARSGDLGDSPEAEWKIGGPGEEADVLLIIASDDEYDLLREVQNAKDDIGEGLELMFEQIGSNPPPPLVGCEHFGFRDGVSQPGVRGRLSDSPDDFLTPRQNPADPHQGKPGQDLIWPGEFVFGYSGQDPSDQHGAGAVAVAGPAWARNGSFIVVRRYRQDVREFHASVGALAEELSSEGEPVTPQKVAAQLLGRWSSGAPLLRAPEADNEALPRDNCADNHFDFVSPSRHIFAQRPGQCNDNVFPPSPGDEAGLICPHAAHIRKVYPRDDPTPGGGKADSQTRRLIRRGIPFGESLFRQGEGGGRELAPATSDRGDGERGLMFVAYQTSITRQFEFIVRFWCNNPDFRSPDAGYDPVVGQNGEPGARERSFRFTLRRADGSVTTLTKNLPEWVSPTGGGYFFSPSISALKLLSG